MTRVWPGRPAPLGAQWDGEGVNFSLFSRHATGVELCLFDAQGQEQRVPLARSAGELWTAYLPDVRPGARYGYRVHGDYVPEEGQRFNPNKLLIDPYAKAIDELVWHDSLFGYRIGDAETDLSFSDVDSGPHAPRCTVVDDAFAWGRDAPPRTPLERSIVYECHVRGMTMSHPEVPAELRGTYLGLASDPILEHLRSLSITAVELLPVQHFVDTRHLNEGGLRNYWGYDSLGFFAPARRYARYDPVSEFKSMVKAFHREGIEVWLDVVYNHTGEGNQLGPTLSMRGVDNASYYRLQEGRRHHVDFTGCGNTLDVRQPRVLQLVLDSLRYWVRELHVDGFRFDLAPVLGRDDQDFDSHAAFFEMVRQDPLLSEVKLSAEPWDVGPDGYQLGAFPAGWSEWNAAYRDCVRGFWRGDRGRVPELASRLAGSSDIFARDGAPPRPPQASVNLITCHDGFTLEDVVSYESKHNDANGEDGRDGHDDNHSRNWGVEGPTDSDHILRARDRAKRNMLSTLALSPGVPLIGHGDELGRTQGGNNNAYCQDNETAWVNWELDDRAREFLTFTRETLALRARSPVFRRSAWFSVEDLAWIGTDGAELTEEQWNDSRARILGRLIPASGASAIDERGRFLAGRTQLLLLNGGTRTATYRLPAQPEAGVWHEALNTARPGSRRLLATEEVQLAAHSLLLLEFEVRP